MDFDAHLGIARFSGLALRADKDLFDGSQITFSIHILGGKNCAQTKDPKIYRTCDLSLLKDTFEHSQDPTLRFGWMGSARTKVLHHLQPRCMAIHAIPTWLAQYFAIHARTQNDWQ